MHAKEEAAYAWRNWPQPPCNRWRASRAALACLGDLDSGASTRATRSPSCTLSALLGLLFARVRRYTSIQDDQVNYNSSPGWYAQAGEDVFMQEILMVARADIGRDDG